jgi:hypothetical protein
VTDQRLVTFPWPDHIASWSVSTKHDGKFYAWVGRKFDLRDDYGRILGPSLDASAEGDTPYEAVSIALNKLEKKTQAKLIEQNANPPKAHPIIQTEVDDLMDLLGL